MRQSVEVVFHLRMVVSISVLFIVFMRNRFLVLMAALAMFAVAMVHRNQSGDAAAVTFKAPHHTKHLRSEHCKSAEHKEKSQH